MPFFSKVNKKLMQAAKKLVKDKDLQWDLYQEMSIHLWQIKRQYPDKDDAWYLVSCRNCAINYLKCGKSIDSKNRTDVEIKELYNSRPGGHLELIPLIDDTDYESETVFSDLVAKIKAKLTATQRQILDYLLKGFTETEIGNLLSISQQAVSKHRRVIKQRAIEFWD